MKMEVIRCQPRRVANVGEMDEAADGSPCVGS